MADKTKIDNPKAPEHAGTPVAQQVAAAGRSAASHAPKPEMRNEDRRSAPNRHVQTTRTADRPGPTPEQLAEEQRRHDREVELKRDPDGKRATLRSEVTGETIVSDDVGERGPDDLTGGIVTESRQTGAPVTNEQRAGALPESSRRANEEAAAKLDEEEEPKKRDRADVGDKR